MIIECPKCNSRDDYEKYVSVRFEKLVDFCGGKSFKISKVDCTGCKGIIEWAEEIYSFVVKEKGEDKNAS